MTIETDFVAALDAHAALVALVGTRISKNAVDQGTPMPIVAFSAQHDPEHSLAGATLGERVLFNTECWGETAAQAAAVADQVVAALAAHNAVQTSDIATVLSRSSAYDGELKLDGEVLTVEWWRL